MVLLILWMQGTHRHMNRQNILIVLHLLGNVTGSPVLQRKERQQLIGALLTTRAILKKYQNLN